MKLSRNLAITIRNFIDEYTPPILRDQYWFMALPLRLHFGKMAPRVMTFKKDVLKMSDEEFRQIYKDIDDEFIYRETDVNEECFYKIPRSILGKTVLEVGCGRAKLAVEMSKKYAVTASDFVITKTLIEDNPKIHFVNANAEALPFKDRSFDTVVSTHMIEHVKDIEKTIQELRRVTKKRLIIVTPMQRPYKYTFDLHVHFFPYPESFQVVMGFHKKATCQVIGGDLFYIEDK